MAKKKILLADDEEIIRSLLSEALRSDTCEIDTVENGLDAIVQMRRRSYDLIITDYRMPGMDGLELIQRIKAEYPGLPIILITGQGPAEGFRNSGATVCITKPLDIRGLIALVGELLDAAE